MVDANNSQPPAEHRSKLRQILDIIADILARQRELGSICRQLEWDNRELLQRITALEAQAAAYRKKYPNG
jgi:hypothetical protein